MRDVLRIVTGVGLVLLGIVGLILPVMPGWIFLIPGLVILGEYFPPIRRLLTWAEAKVAKHDPGFFKKWTEKRKREAAEKAQEDPAKGPV